MRFSRFSFFAPASACALVLVAALFPHTARAQPPLFDFTGGVITTITGSPTGFTLGFDFTVTGTRTITGLGLFDVGADGLTNTHNVGLFNSAGNLLTSVLVTTANSTTVASTSTLGNYRRVAIAAPVVLTSGTYTLGATYAETDADSIITKASTSNTAGVAYVTSRLSSGPGLQKPTFIFNSADPGLFGPMAFTTPAAAGAPEPGTLPLLGMGLTLGAGLFGTVRRKAKSFTLA